MAEESERARLAAASLAQGAAMANLLRAYGRGEHASQLEAALAELTDIIAEQVGREALSDALDWITDQTWDCALAPGAGRHGPHN